MDFHGRGQTSEYSIDQLHPEVLKVARQYISGDDQVLLCFGSKYEMFSKGFLGESITYASIGASICTQHRVIYISRHTASGSNKLENFVRTMELSDIESIQEVQQARNDDCTVYGIDIAGRGGAKMSADFYSSQSQSRFATVLRQAVARAQGKTSLAVPGSANSVEAIASRRFDYRGAISTKDTRNRQSTLAHFAIRKS